MLRLGSAAAQSPGVVIEVDAAAEHWVDPRATRRLVALEVSDVAVPPARASQSTALFYRVLAEPTGGVRVELWERGELHDARRIPGKASNLQIGARRVALAAAELARGLRQRRLQERRLQSERERAQRELERARAERTVEGPFALRSALSLTRAREQVSFGSSLGFELNLHHKLRLDLGLNATGGQNSGGPWVSALEITAGPARRFALGSRFDISVAGFLGWSLLHASRVASLDAVPRQHETWTARAGASFRFEPRLTRRIRASFGANAGWYLRRVPSSDAALTRNYEGGFIGLELGLIATPP